VSDWLSNSPYGMGGPGTNTIGGGGFSTFRDSLDAKRVGKLPEAEYPDGYLNSTHSRREDRLMDKLGTRINDRSYQRGVHVGEKIPNENYFWTPNFGPTTGIEYEAQGVKWTASGSEPHERLAHMGKVAALTPSEMGQMYEKYGIAPEAESNPQQSAWLQQFRPSWRSA